ncbi:MAG: pyruvate kinase [Gemmataceae bacterium]|nr:pyruvate kinase [Gemmataceae bacterium]
MTDGRRVRIVATLGPATDRPGVLDALLNAGLDVARINLSHGSADESILRVRDLRERAGRLGKTVAVLADLPGPKCRVLLTAPRDLVPGSRITFSQNPVADEIGVTEPELLDGVKTGHRILLDDGRFQLRVDTVGAGRVSACVLVGGVLSPKKGINLPDSPLAIPAVTPGDQIALAASARMGADWLALSFVRSAGAADELRKAAREFGLEVPVLAKIERPEAIDNLPRIVAAFDGLMVARGDLGVELPLETVPMLQKRVIREARAWGKPVITATDMLDSMRNNPRPTRAEASDVANSVYDGTDAVMLSGETAVGQYPVEAVEYMDRIVREAERGISNRRATAASPYESLDDEVAAAFCHLAEASGAEALIVPTLTGKTVREVARHRPRAAIVAPVPDEAIRRRLSMVWGVKAVPLPVELPAGADRIDAAVRSATLANAVAAGQRVLVIAGHPVETGVRMPTIRLCRVTPEGTAGEP